MSFPAYADYKDSKVEWLGAVPGHWTVYRIANLYREVVDAGTDDLPILSVSIHSGVSDEEAAPGDSERKIVRSDDRSKYKKVLPNDLVYNMMRAWQGGFGAVQVPGLVSPAYVVARPMDETPSKYVELLLRTPGAVEEMRRRSRGVTDFRLRLYWDEFKDIKIALPPLSEREAIVRFLDRETAKIDGLVAEQERLIALLKEKRQAVISHAVTKGLNPDAPMKDSGIEWLGKIPAHWDVVRVKHVIDKIEQGWSPQCEAAQVDSPDQWGVLKVGCVNGERFNPHENKVLPSDLEPLPDLAIRAGDVLVSRANTRDLVGSAAVVEQDFDRLLLCDKLYRLRVDSDVAHPAFLTHYLRSSMARGQIEVAATGASSSMLNIGQGVIMEMPFALPPLAEQAAVVDQVATTQASLSDLVAAAKSAITLLQERRAALISAAVTGKIDVRGPVASAVPAPLDLTSAERVLPSLRAVVGGHVVLQLGRMGRMAVMKGGFLAEAHCGLSELGGRYERYAAGPYDSSLIAAMERGAADLCGVQTDEPAEKGEPVTYSVPKGAGAPVEELRALAGEERAQRLSRLLADLSGIGRDGVEAVATLYAVWNDLMAADRPADDDAICTGVLTDWHDEKAKKFKRADLELWIAWMRRNGVVPNGTAPRTDHQGNLFA